MATSDNQSNGGLREAQVSPKYLHSNSTSHLWPFSAVAELTDNAYDPDCHAAKMWIDYKMINEEFCLEFIDNGAGMTPDKVNKMLGFGFNTKESKNGRDAIGMYGNGFKSGSMRLGKDAMVFTKSSRNSSRRRTGVGPGTPLRGNVAEVHRKNGVGPGTRLGRDGGLGTPLGKDGCPASPVDKDAAKDWAGFLINNEGCDGGSNVISGETCTVGFMSQTYLSKIGAETVLIPMATWSNGRLWPGCECSLKAITDHSLFSSEAELLKQFDLITSTSGTRILIHTLAKDSEDKSELDFSDPYDIIYTERQYQSIDDPLAPRITVDTPLYRRSLREYLSILYLKPKLHIYLRGKKVKTRYVAKSLGRKENDTYTPRGEDPVQITLGFAKMTDDKNGGPDYGALLYTRNRLIVAYLKMSEAVKDVIVVTEVNHLTPIHNKQDFEKNDKYNTFVSTLRQKAKDYGSEKIDADCEIQSQKWTWAQCDQCSKWRRLQDIEDEEMLPDKWCCYMNNDPSYNRCDVDEEQEDDQERRVTPKYTVTRSKKRKEKERSESSKKRKIRQMSDDSNDMTGNVSSPDFQPQSPMQAQPLLPTVTISSDAGQVPPPLAVCSNIVQRQPAVSIVADIQTAIGQPLPSYSYQGTAQIHASSMQAERQPMPSCQFQAAEQPMPSCSFQDAQQPMPSSTIQGAGQPMASSSFQDVQQPLPSFAFQGAQQSMPSSAFQGAQQSMPSSAIHGVQQPMPSCSRWTTEQIMPSNSSVGPTVPASVIKRAVRNVFVESTGSGQSFTDVGRSGLQSDPQTDTSHIMTQPVVTPDSQHMSAVTSQASGGHVPPVSSQVSKFPPGGIDILVEMLKSSSSQASGDVVQPVSSQLSTLPTQASHGFVQQSSSQMSTLPSHASGGFVQPSLMAVVPSQTSGKSNLLNATQLSRVRNLSKNMVSPTLPALSPQISQRMKTLEDKCSEIQGAMDKLINEVTEKNNVIKELERVKQNQMNALKMQDQKIQEQEDHLAESKAEYLNNEQTVLDLEERMSTLDMLCQQKDNDMSELQERLQEANTLCQVNENAMSEMQKSLTEAISTCKVSDSAMADLKARCKQKDITLAAQRELLSDANSRADQAEKMKDELQQTVTLTETKLENVTSECQHKDIRLTTLQNQLEIAKSQYQQDQTKLSELQQNLVETGKQNLCEEKDRKIEELQKKICRIESREKHKSIEIEKEKVRLLQAVKESKGLKFKCQQYEMTAKKHVDERKALQKSIKEAINNCERSEVNLKLSRKLCSDQLEQIHKAEQEIVTLKGEHEKCLSEAAKTIQSMKEDAQTLKNEQPKSQKMMEENNKLKKKISHQVHKIGDLEKKCSEAKTLRLEISSLLHLMLPDLDLPQLSDVDQAVCEMVQAYKSERDSESLATCDK